MGKVIDNFTKHFKQKKFNPDSEKIMMMYGCFEDPTDDTKEPGQTLDFKPEDEEVEFLYGVFPWEEDEQSRFDPSYELEEDLYGVFPWEEDEQ